MNTDAKYLHQIQDALLDCAIVAKTDIKGNITYVNDFFVELSGYTREELIGQNHRILKSNRHAPEVYQNLWKTISRGEIWHGTLCNLNKNGSEYWVKTNIFPIKDEQGKIHEYLSIRYDITHEVHQKEALERVKNELVKSKQSAEEFLANMQQELANPLNIIQGYADILKEKLHDKEEESYLVDTILSSSDVLKCMLQDMILLSALKQESIYSTASPISFYSLFSEAVHEFQDYNSASGVEITLNYNLEKNLILILNPHHMSRVIHCLIDNAIKFTHEGDCSITVDASTNSGDNYLKDLNIVISDNGIGIPEKDQAKVFLPFYQVNTAKSKRARGVGLGLCIAKKVVEHYGGNISIVSVEGEGTRVSIHFDRVPIATGPADDYLY